MSLSYKESLVEAMTMLAVDPLFRAVGYGLLGGRGANGTMKMIPDSKISEVTVAEGLMAGMAMGLSLAGLKPLLFLERFDFIFGALDCIVNHLDKAAEISGGEFTPSVIIRVVVGNKTKPLFTGPTHTQDHTDAMKAMLKMPVFALRDAYEVTEFYKYAKERQDAGLGSTMLIEMKDLL